MLASALLTMQDFSATEVECSVMLCYSGLGLARCKLEQWKQVINGIRLRVRWKTRLAGAIGLAKTTIGPRPIVGVKLKVQVMRQCTSIRNC